jgi:putative transposase
MIVNQAYRYELDPTKIQLIALARHAGTARFAYNWGLRERIERFEKNEGAARFTNAIAQHRELNALKESRFPWMYEVSKCAPQEALRDLDRAFKNFRRGRDSGRKTGFPKFKCRGVHDSFRLTGSIKTRERSVVLPVLGEMRVKEATGKLRGRILSATVTREADRWYVSLAVERERPEPSPVLGPVVGIDLGLVAFAVLSDGERVSAPNLLARRQRRHARRVKGSNNRKRSARRLARLHRRIHYRRLDFLHKLTTRLARTKSVIVVEDLAVGNMTKNKSLSRSISDVGWSEFRRQLTYKTKWYGSRLVVADRFLPSSKTCSSCSAVKTELELSEREFVCQTCGVALDRDLNAAKNLARFAERATESSSGSDACGETTVGRAEGASRDAPEARRRPRRDRKDPACPSSPPAVISSRSPTG